MKRTIRPLIAGAAALAALAGPLAAALPSASAASGVIATFTKTQDWGSGRARVVLAARVAPAPAVAAESLPQPGSP